MNVIEKAGQREKILLGLISWRGVESFLSQLCWASANVWETLAIKGISPSSCSPAENSKAGTLACFSKPESICRGSTFKLLCIFFFVSSSEEPASRLWPGLSGQDHSVGRIPHHSNCSLQTVPFLGLWEWSTLHHFISGGSHQLSSCQCRLVYEEQMLDGGSVVVWEKMKLPCLPIFNITSTLMQDRCR